MAMTNEMALATKAAGRPNTLLNQPPAAAPSASITPHVLPNNALACRNSSGLRARFGTPASMAGFTNAASALMLHWNTNSGHTREVLAVSRPSEATAWASESTSSRRRRSKRSTTGPAMGEARNDGSEKLT